MSNVVNLSIMALGYSSLEPCLGALPTVKHWLCHDSCNGRWFNSFSSV